MKPTHYTIRYEFHFPAGDRKQFELVLDEETMSLANFSQGEKPGWTNLLHEQCGCCPLDAQRHPHCPIAVNIAELV